MRLRNSVSGAVVSVREEKAARLGAEWVPVEDTGSAPAGEEKPAPRRRATTKKAPTRKS